MCAKHPYHQVEAERFTLVVRRLEEDKKELGRQARELGEENKQLKRNVNRLILGAAEIVG